MIVNLGQEVAWVPTSLICLTCGYICENDIDSPSEWSAGATTATTKNCYGETVPFSGTSYPGAYPDQMKVINEVISGMNYPAYLLDITMLSELRKDGHPSIYSGDLSPAQRANPDRSADCSHWCLPGLPDTWNQLLYTILLYWSLCMSICFFSSIFSFFLFLLVTEI